MLVTSTTTAYVPPQQAAAEVGMSPGNGTRWYNTSATKNVGECVCTW